MRAKQGIHILGRNHGHQAQVAFMYCREASSRSRRDTYDASKLVLDLDAADNKYVRRYEDQTIEDSEPSRAPQNSYLRSRQEKNRLRKEAAMLRRQSTIPDIYRATDADYLAFALVGDPFNQPSPYTSDLRAVLSENLLSTRMGSFKQQIQWLKDNADRSNISSLPSNLSMVHQHVAYRSMILDCQNFQQLSRATAHILKNLSGCEWISSNGDLIVDAIKRFRGGQDYTEKGERALRPGQILKYINALVQKLESMDLDPGPALCNTGMHYAAKAVVYSAVKKYIVMVVDKGYISSKQQDSALKNLVRGYHWERSQASAQGPGRKKEDRRAALLELLTGWNANGTPRESEKREICFASLAQGSPQMYNIYIANLGRLGAYEALWFELMNFQLLLIERDEFQAMTAKEGGHLFFSAFQIASDFLSSPVELGSETDSIIRDVLPKNIVLASDSIGPSDGVKGRERLVAYYQSCLHRLQEKLVNGANGPQDVLLALEKLFKKNLRQL